MPQVVDKISKDKDFELVLGGENRHIACLFVDIRGFTTMSESLKPEEVVEILNEYLSLTTNSIFQNGGTLDKFVGDATMAVFNAPFDLEDYIYKAVCTARDMKAASTAATRSSAISAVISVWIIRQSATPSIRRRAWRAMLSGGRF